MATSGLGAPRTCRMEAKHSRLYSPSGPADLTFVTAAPSDQTSIPTTTTKSFPANNLAPSALTPLLLLFPAPPKLSPPGRCSCTQGQTPRPLRLASPIPDRVNCPPWGVHATGVPGSGPSKEPFYCLPQRSPGSPNSQGTLWSAPLAWLRVMSRPDPASGMPGMIWHARDFILNLKNFLKTAISSA